MQLFVITSFLLAAVIGAPANDSVKKENAVHHATGSFEVKVTPDPAGSEWGRMDIEKRFAGDLEGTSRGQMLSAFGSVKTSGAYVAVERVTAKLAGRDGTFVLVHRGEMRNGQQTMQITVVPDSGTGGLQGLTGTMQIHVEGGKHSYDFEYELP